ncbi:50S ribosomal protein L11 methyltransferase [Chlorobium sp. N1]|uniref:50S ribosomal protein L11 methyltransferase n=1 Tax=Chlorobium sp. N1 TaxID=2491138 RepID=UPI0010407FB6|nr:50S ribosomal protein L11 methyltransferase [Chlorobium sp. N1]TCD48304.1 50S ribosomal protein L11 methyltransferase [Chlorobium sp. N1]
MPGTHHHIELSIPIPAEQHELAVALLMMEGIGYFQEEDAKLLAYVPEAEWTEEKLAAVSRALEALPGGAPPLRTEFMADRNWNAEWEAHLQPIEISDRFLIVQKKGVREPRPGQIAIEINPKMSFGTGYHATTRLMLRQMEDMRLENEKIMDIGTGTGVLAIAARKLGNTLPILAFDNNAWAAENAVENIEENEAADIRIELLDAEEDLAMHLREGYTLILANINKNVIDRILPVISANAGGATVLLSGILVYDEPWLKKLLKRLDCEAVRTIYEDEWLSCLVRTPGNQPH